MARRIRRLLAGTALLAVLVPASAGAADPSVTVRAEGTADTLVPRVNVALGGAAVVRDGHSCPGDSAAAVLDRATSGAWNGTWNAGFSDWELSAIKGEAHSFAATAYWGFFVNDVPTSLGICGQQLQAGDRVLFAPAPSNGDVVGVLSLEGVPARAVPGVPFTVTVKRTATEFLPPDYLPVTATLPLAGATIALPGGGTATTGAGGTATITLTAGGAATLRAEKPGEVRSAGEPVCASTGADGLCGSVAAGSATSPAAQAADVIPAAALIGGLREGARLTRRTAPRTLSGTVQADASGIRDILLRLTRRAGSRCETYDAARERWVRSRPCGTEGGRWFSVGSRAAWSYLLPGALTPARYVLDVRTIDGAGNVTRGAERSGDAGRPRTRVVFTVR